MEPLHPTDPPHIGDYRLTARLGSGGMGQVYLATTASGRQLVIKVIRPELAQEAGFRARFAREADAARRVGGFHTAQVVDSAPDAETPWIATTYIPGPTLAQAVRAHGPIAPPALHALAAGLTEGLKAVHTGDLVHRDLKPDNIILADDGPRIIDFGIARPVDADSMTTQGAVFGTLPYMSPEQTDGSRVGASSDVFSLGTVFAYAATGTNPFTGATMAETLRRLISPPPDPGDLDPDIRALIVECWSHDPTQRPTPDQILTRFAGLDLQDSWPPPHLSGLSRAESRSEPISDPSPTPTDTAATELNGTLRRTRVQQPPRVPETATAPPLTPAPPAPADTESDSERPGQRRIWYVGAAAAAVLVLVLALIAWNSFGPDTGEPGTSGAGAAGPSPSPTGPSELWEVDVQPGYSSGMSSMAFSPDGTTLATSSSGDDVQLWDATTGQTITTLADSDGDVRSVAFSPDGTTLATGSYDARVWDTDTGETITTLTGRVAGQVESVAFSPDGTILAAGGWLGIVRLWDTDTGETISTLTDDDDAVRSVAFSPDGDILAVGIREGARLWDVDTGEAITTLTGHDRGVYSVAFSPDGSLLATTSNDGTARLWDTDTGETVDTLTGHEGTVASVAFSPDGTTVATGDEGDNARLWDVSTGEVITTLEGDEGAGAFVAFGPDGTLATGGLDGSVRLWSLG